MDERIEGIAPYPARGDTATVIVTRRDLPVLVNLDRAETITYQQIAEFDTHTRIIAAPDRAKGLMPLLARTIKGDNNTLTMQGIDLATWGEQYARNEKGGKGSLIRHDAKPPHQFRR